MYNFSSTAAVDILFPQEPTAISVNETYPVSLVCSARGFPAVDIAWWYQNTQLMDSDPRLSIQSMTVENNNGIFNVTSTLTIPSMDRSDAGNYACVASNTVFGSPMSDVEQFMITVNCKYLVTVHVSIPLVVLHCMITKMYCSNEWSLSSYLILLFLNVLGLSHKQPLISPLQSYSYTP